MKQFQSDISRHLHSPELRSGAGVTPQVQVYGLRYRSSLPEILPAPLKITNVQMANG